MKTALGRLINRLDIGEQRASELEDPLIETFQSENPDAKDRRQLEEYNMCIMGMPERKKRKEQNKYWKQAQRISPN